MPTRMLSLDFVSDVACPWCAVGLWSLLEGLRRARPEVTAELRLQPFELNPHMPPEGEDAIEHLAHKYGITAEQIARNREGLRARGEAVGFVFAPAGPGRVRNTFDAHRLLHWAGTIDLARQLALKQALLVAYHGQGRDVSDRATLASLAEAAGLDGARARSVLSEGLHAEAVRAAERRWQEAGIDAVPSLVIDEAHLLQGGQPPEVYEQALREIAAQRGAVVAG